MFRGFFLGGETEAFLGDVNRNKVGKSDGRSVALAVGGRHSDEVVVARGEVVDEEFRTVVVDEERCLEAAFFLGYL